MLWATTLLWRPAARKVSKGAKWVAAGLLCALGGLRGDLVWCVGYGAACKLVWCQRKKKPSLATPKRKERTVPEKAGHVWTGWLACVGASAGDDEVSDGCGLCKVVLT